MLRDAIEREVFERPERLGTPYFLTGSEALAHYGQPRQTMDVDIVVGMRPGGRTALSHAP